MSELLQYFQNQQQAMIDLLTELVNYESPSHDKALVDQLAGFLANHFQTNGASSVTRMQQTEVGDFLLARWNETSPGKPITILVHMDTVLPQGTINERPVRIEDGKLYGPGAVDMKGGIVVAVTAIKGLIERGELPDRPIWLLANSDEEIGSRYSASTIEEIAAQSGLILVMEPGTSDGSIKTRRKGGATYRVHVQGRASHAGNEPEAGINAIVELAQQVLKINALNDYRNGTSVSVTMIEGGTAGNVIPAAASLFIDNRVLTQRAMDEVRGAILGLGPHLPGAQVRVEAIHSRPPMEYNDLMIETYTQGKAIGEKYGITVRGESVGGGSDGNITAAIGVPTLDGLGPYGGGLHAEHEHVLISSMPERAALIAGILKDWAFAD